MAGSGVTHHSLDRPGIALAGRRLPDCEPSAPGALQTGAERLIRVDVILSRLLQTCGFVEVCGMMEPAPTEAYQSGKS
jgi:hypothetical protein